MDEFLFHRLATPALVVLGLGPALEFAFADVTLAVRHFHSWKMHFFAPPSFFRNPSPLCIHIALLVRAEAFIDGKLA